MAHFLDGKGNLPRSTRRGLEARLDNPAVKPPSVTPQEFASMSTSARESYNNARMAYVNGGMNVHTPMQHAVFTAVRLYMHYNAHDPVDRRGLLLSGPSSTGKTHTTLAVLRATTNAARAHNPDFRKRGIIPAITVTVPRDVGQKSLVTQICSFFENYAHLPRRTLDELTSDSVRYMLKHQVALVVLEEVHNLARSNAAVEASRNLLRRVFDLVPATFVLTGLNLDTGGLLDGITGEQIGTRFSTIHSGNLSLATPDDQEDWLEVLNTFETELCLIGHELGTFADLSTYLYKRTNGRIGELAYLFRMATTMRIGEFTARSGPSEQLTKADFELIPSSADFL